MTDTPETPAINPDYLYQLSKIVAAFVSNNSLPYADLHKLMAETSKALLALSAPQVKPAAPAQEPAVSVKKSITPDFLVCLEDGKTFKSMKRYLSNLGMTPDDYRSKWGLPSDYPMVAPNYAAKRSELAKSNGLGRKSAQLSSSPVKRTRKPKN